MSKLPNEGAPKGILLMDKPVGKTSFQSLGGVKRVYQTKKVGHTGTLDKFARGLMIVLVGKYTKLNPLFTGMDKTYEALIRFGSETDTLDPEGEVVCEAPVPTLNDIEAVLGDFMGKQDQVPPRYSAIHVNGKRAWKMAREGVEVEMKSRPIRIDQLEILDWNGSELSLKVACSSGTYIRSLARDIALACGSRAHLRELVRTRVGEFYLDEAVQVNLESPAPSLLSLKDVLSHLPFSGNLFLDDDQYAMVRLGVPPERIFSHDPFKEGLSPLFSPSGDFAALLEKAEGRLKYRFVM
ncbi:MAG: tRNA pseudouridine(55) synthase TruB [Spirochaetales bacterium]|nr:tRNA pseudouridine(55) synthase TruB [Spirochaetales bacterium]